MKLYRVGKIPRPSSGVHSLYTVHSAFEQDQNGTSSILVLLESCLQNCMVYTIAECTMNELLMMHRGIVRNM